MKTNTKITVALLAILLLVTGCSKSKDGVKPVAKEITTAELVDYYILEEYTPKPEYEAEFGTNPLLVCTYVVYLGGYGYVTTGRDAANYYVPIATELSYNLETGITTLKTAFCVYELSRDDNEQIIVKKSILTNANEDEALTSSYIQLVKRTSGIYEYNTFKEISGTGYYRFSVNKWRYKQGAAPNTNELTWNYVQTTNQIWSGQDGGSAQYPNLFLILPKGNGWKGQHKDKDLLIVNTFLDGNSLKAVGNIGIYELTN